MTVRNALVAVIAIVVFPSSWLHTSISSLYRERELTMLHESELIRMAQSGNVEERLKAVIELSRRSSKNATLALIESALTKLRQCA